MIIAFNTLFPNTAMELLPSTPEIGSSSMLENSNLKENSKNCGNTLQSSTSESPRKSVVDPSEKAKLADPIFTPQKPGSSHPLQSVLDYCQNPEADKYYVLFNTPLAGIYDSWSAASKVINGVKSAVHKSFKTKEKAIKEFNDYRTKTTTSYSAKAAQPPSTSTTKLTRLGSIRKPPTPTPPALKPNKTIFYKLMNKIVSYKKNPEQCHLEGWYPTWRYSEIPKVVILPNADPNITYSFYIHGLVDSLYFTDTKL